MRVPVWVDIAFDLESDGEVVPESAVDPAAVRRAVMSVMEGSCLDHLVDEITDQTGWCIQSLSLTVDS